MFCDESFGKFTSADCAAVKPTCLVPNFNHWQFFTNYTNLHI
jgi:hypothetical protein